MKTWTRFGLIAVVLGLLGSEVAQAQAPVVPAGAGTEADPYRITQLGNLVWMAENVGSSYGKYYQLMNDIDATATAGWNDGAGFAPIGSNSDASFDGMFNGNSKVIRGLTINRPLQRNVGLFGCVLGAVIKDLGLTGGSVTGKGCVGALVGESLAGTVSGCYATGAVAGGDAVGGLIGYIWLAGTVSGCYAMGTVTGTASVGGLVGYQCSGTVNGCYATGVVTGNASVGGLVGEIFAGSPVSQCYATGSVTGSTNVGGLVGSLSSGSVSECYATGSVTGTSSVGGLVGSSFFGGGPVTNSYWDTNTTGQATSDGGTGEPTAQMVQRATFVGWDFTNVWGIIENETSPFLRWQGPFDGATSLGGDWRWLDWFGYFSVRYYPWVYHRQHGWMYCVGTSPSSIWLYSLDMAWLWTSSTLYPYLYRYNDDAWLYYLNGSSSPSWFYNLKTGLWEQH